MRHAAQVHNMTHFEKRSPMITEKKFDCGKASYKTVTLVDFVYTHNCFPEGWEEFLALKEVQQDIGEISPLLSKEAEKYQIEPPMPNLFKAFNVGSVPIGSMVDYPVVGRDQVKVVIIGQDPVPEAGQATGLAFSLKPGQDPCDSVPTVFNMLVELKLEGMNVDLKNGDLTEWVDRGVLLLNPALTVRQGTSVLNAGSHQSLWRDFTRLLVKHISDKGQPTAWILWGVEAKELATKDQLIDMKKHYIKAGGHPSTSGKNACIRFFGRNYFKCANEFLVNKGRGAVDWSLPPRIVIGTSPEDCNAHGLNE